MTSVIDKSKSEERREIYLTYYLILPFYRYSASKLDTCKIGHLNNISIVIKYQVFLYVTKIYFVQVIGYDTVAHQIYQPSFRKVHKQKN